MLFHVSLQGCARIRAGCDGCLYCTAIKSYGAVLLVLVVESVMLVVVGGILNQRI